MFNFTIPFIDWLKKAWQKIGPMFPEEGATVPLTEAQLQDAYVLDVYGLGIPPTVVTPAVYQQYMTEWTQQWNAIHPGVPVPTAGSTPTPATPNPSGPSSGAASGLTPLPTAASGAPGPAGVQV
jgi:hypothetical protein